MDQYHKINSLYKRTTDGKQMLFGEYSDPCFKYLQFNQWTFTEKVDGTNVRVGWMYGEDVDEVKLAGKSAAAQMHMELIDRLSQLFRTDQAIEQFRTGFPGCNSVVLYGEGYGPKIQNGGKYKDKIDFVLFDVLIDGIWLERSNVENIAERFHLDIVPVIGQGNLHFLHELVQAGFKSTWGDFMAEGIVARPVCELQDRRGQRIITKLKHKDFEGGKR